MLRQISEVARVAAWTYDIVTDHFASLTDSLRAIGVPGDREVDEKRLEAHVYPAVLLLRTVPSDTPVTSPFSLTVAMESSEELHSRAISCMEAG
mgnify:CR=1 FL=1